MKRKSIKSAILMPSIGVLIIGIVVMAVLVGKISSDAARNLTSLLVDARVNQYSNEFLAFTQDVYGSLKATTPVIANYADPEFASTVPDPRGEVIKILTDILTSNEKIYGMWTCWEPDAFDGKDSEFSGASFYDDTGRYTPNVYMDGGQLHVEALTGYDDPVEGEYYQGALKSGKTYVTDPYIYNVGGVDMSFCTFAMPIFKDGKVAGVVGADVNLNTLLNVMNGVKILDDGYLLTISPNGVITTHPDANLLMSHYDESWMGDFSQQVEELIGKGGHFDGNTYLEDEKSDAVFSASGVNIAETDRNWAVCAVVPEKNVMASSNSLLRTIIIIGGALILFVGAVIYMIVTGRLKRLPIIAEAAQRISEGDFNVQMDSRYNDEVNDISTALINVKQTVESLLHEIDNMSHEFEAGNVKIKLDESRYNGEFRTVAEEINRMFGEMLTDISNSIDIVTEFGNGNFDVDIKQYPGDKEVITTSFKAVQANLKQFNRDLSGIIDSATHGDLNTRLDVSAYKGDWSKMAGGINGLLTVVVEPIREAIDALNRLSAGDLDASVRGDYLGEFAAMKTALNDTVSMLASYIKEISAILTAMSQNDLNQSVEREYVGEFSAIKTALNRIIDMFNRVISEIYTAAEQVAAGARLINESNTAFAEGSSEQATSVEELNSIVTTINDNAADNTVKAKEAEALSDKSKDNAVKGDKDMNNMLVSMESIKESSDGISKIIKVIDDIAFQTNLLALNAAVEAARAGEHGKGFAVVAEEVRNLAGRSQSAAKETSGLIEESILRVNDGAKIAEQTANALRTIMGDVSSVAGIISDISKSSGEQSISVNQISEGISQITQVVNRNTATTAEAASASEQLSSQAELLHDLVSVFKLRQ